MDWVDIEQPDVVYPYTPGEPAPTANDTALTYVSSQGWAQGAAYFSRLEGQVYDDDVVYFTSTQGGGAAEIGPHDPVGYGNGSGQVWAYDTRTPEAALSSSSRPGRSCSTSPTTSRPPRAARWWSARTTPRTTTSAVFRSSGRLWDIALNRLRSATGTDRSGDEFAGSTFSPDGHTLFVNIQASRRHDVRDLGAVARDRRLTSGAARRHPPWHHQGEADPRTRALSAAPAGRSARYLWQSSTDGHAFG